MGFYVFVQKKYRMRRLHEIIKSKFSKGLGKDFLWTFVGQMLLMFILLVVNKILSNVLTIDEFGKYNIIRRSTSVMTFILLGGLGIAMPRYLSMSICKQHYRETQALLISSLLYLFVISILFSTLYLFLYNQLVTFIIGSYDINFYILCLLYAISVALNSYAYAYYRGLGQFKMFNICQIIVQVFLLIPLFFCVKNLYLIICFWTCANYLFIIVQAFKEYKSYKQIIRNLKVNTTSILTQFGIISAYSFPRLIGDFFLFACSAFPTIYIGKHLGLEQTSYYSIGVSLVTMVIPIYSFLGVVLLPVISKMIVKNQIMDANRLILKLAAIYIILALFFTVVLFYLIEPLIKLLFAAKYLVGSGICKIIVLSVLPQSMYLLFRNPNDAVSVFPFNSLILGISFIFMVFGFICFETLFQYAYVYLGVSILQGILSMFIWFYLVYKKVRNV